MDCLARTLFDDFNDDVPSPPKPTFTRPHTPPVMRSTGRLPLPCISEDVSFGSPKSVDSLYADDLNSTGEMISPPCSPSKLPSPSPNKFLQSPPSIHRGFLALKLFDTPATPKTLLNKFKNASNEQKSKEYDKTEPVRSYSRTSRNFAKFKDLDKRPGTEPRADKRPFVYANINPFTPSPSVVKHKRTRHEFERYFLYIMLIIYRKNKKVDCTNLYFPHIFTVSLYLTMNQVMRWRQKYVEIRLK